MSRHEEIKADAKREQAEHDRRVEERRRSDMMDDDDPASRRVGGDRRERDRGRPLLEIPLSEQDEARMEDFLRRFEPRDLSCTCGNCRAMAEGWI